MLREPKTHKVTIEAEVEIGADSDQHSKVVVENMLRGKGFDIKKMETERLEWVIHTCIV